MDRLKAHSGVLVVNKPRGPTSHDVVARTRRLYRTRSVGHAGTLDPMASGVLVLLIGQATKLSPYLTAANKRYRAVVRLGVGTDTLDAEGNVIAEASLAPRWLDPGTLARAVEAERGRRQQVPPAFSAIRVRGVRAHRAARAGDALPLPPRPVAVQALEVVRASDSELELELVTSKGYYVRSLARDLGDRLGVPAHLTLLERQASGPFELSEALTLSDGDLPPLIPLADAAARSLPWGSLTEAGARAALQGKRLTLADFRVVPTGSPAAWLSADGVLIAIGTREEDTTFRVRRGFGPSDRSDSVP